MPDIPSVQRTLHVARPDGTTLDDPAREQARLTSAIDRLQAAGEIEYTGEFGAEITTFIPFAFWLKTQGLLAGRRVVTYAGMAPYYYFLAPDEYREKPDTRRWQPTEARGWPTNSTYTATRRPWQVMPDYRARYGGQGLRFERPVLFIQNKFTVEWDIGPINYLPIWALKGLLHSAAGRFDIVYSRPGARPVSGGYASDANDHCEYPDLPVVRGFGDVLVLEDFCAERGAPYNLTKLEILAKSHVFAAVQGGGAHLLACFGNALMLLLHREGEEYPHAYASGPYKYLSTPAPVLMLARDREGLLGGLNVIGATRVEGDQVQVDRGVRPTLDALRI
jgi:hypothetical protein